MGRYRKFFIVAFILVANILFVNTSCFAVNVSDVMKKWVFSGYQLCISGGQINTPMSTSFYKSGNVADDVFWNGGDISLPSQGFGGLEDGKTVGCSDLFLGKGALSKSSGVLQFANISADFAKWNDETSTKSLLVDKIGYSYSKTGNDYITINVAQSTCNDVDSLGDCRTNDKTSLRIYPSDSTYVLDPGQIQWGSAIRLNISNNTLQITLDAGVSCAWKTGYVFSIPIQSDLNKFAQAITDTIKQSGINPWCEKYHYLKGNRVVDGAIVFSFNNGEVVQKGEIGTYEFGRGNRATVGKSIKTLSGITDLNLNGNERYALYLHYLKSTVEERKGSINCSADSDLGSGYSKVRLKQGDSFKDCYVSFNGASPDSISVNDLVSQGSNNFPIIRSVTMQNVIDWFNTVDTSKLDDVDVINDYDPLSPSSDGDDGDDSCLAADLNGQGWLLCSALSNSTYAATFLDNVIDDWLRVDTQYYDGDSSTYKIWEVMRGIANIIMIILLLVIIVSQLSGFGINNYGIKKMLPRFIVMAILINLSFVICDVAVDFSNLMGVGLRNLFGSIGQNIEAQGTTDYIAILVTSLLSVVGIGGAASSSITTIIPFIIGAEAVGAPIIVLVVLLALIPVIIGLAIFFMMLGGRFIIIVGCIALSPIAFTLFILPNTQGVFKKWWGLFKAALIMYPLCGAVIGISYLVRGFVMTDGDKQIWMGVIAMIAPYLPFFMLPSLLKSTIGMLGTAGNALMSLGDKVKTGAKDGMDAIRHTGAYQDASKAALEKMNVQRAQNTINKLGKLKKDEMSESQKRRLFDAQQTVSAGRMADAQRGLGAYVVTQDEAERRAAAAKDAQELKSYTERNDGMTVGDLDTELGAAVAAYGADKDNNRVRLQAAIISANNKGMNNQLLKKLRLLELSANDSNDSKLLGQLATSNDIVLQQFGKQMSKPLDSRGTLPSGRSLGDYVSGGGDVSLQSALDRIGKNALVGANDDTLGFIKDYAGSSATIDMLVTAGANAPSMKEVNAINEMLRTKVAEPGAKISIDGKQLVGLDSSTVKAIVDNGNDEIKRSLSAVFERVKSSPELMSQMNPQAIEELRRLGNSGGVAPGGGSGPTLYDANGRPLPSSGRNIDLPPRN